MAASSGRTINAADFWTAVDTELKWSQKSSVVACMGNCGGGQEYHAFANSAKHYFDKGEYAALMKFSKRAGTGENSSLHCERIVLWRLLMDGEISAGKSIYLNVKRIPKGYTSWSEATDVEDYGPCAPCRKWLSLFATEHKVTIYMNKTALDWQFTQGNKFWCESCELGKFSMGSGAGRGRKWCCAWCDEKEAYAAYQNNDLEDDDSSESGSEESGARF